MIVKYLCVLCRGFASETRWRTVRDDICIFNALRFIVAKYHATSEVTKRLYTVLGWHMLVVMVIYINQNCQC